MSRKYKIEYQKIVKMDDSETLIQFENPLTSELFESWLNLKGWEMFNEWLDTNHYDVKEL